MLVSGEDRVTHRLSVLKVENEYGPDLRVDFLQYESKAILRDLDSFSLDFDQSSKLQQLLYTATQLDAVDVHIDARASHHIPENTLPLPACELVQLGYGDEIWVGHFAGHTEGFVIPTTGQG